MESGKFTEFVGARVSEVKVNSNIEEEWLWLVRNCNPADLRTRTNASLQDLGPGSEYQESMAWLREPVDSWPCKKSFSPPPEEKLRKDMMEGVCNVLKGTKGQSTTEVQFPSVKRGGIDRLLRIYGYVIAAVYKWRKRQELMDLSSLTLLRAGSKESGIRWLNAEELGSCTYSNWPKKGWDFQVRKCWHRIY
jgi:hypothetical protein